MRTTHGMFVLCGVVVLSCVTPSPSETVQAPPMRPPSSGERWLDYKEAMEYTSRAIASEGYVPSDVYLVQELHPNYWRVRYGMAPKGSSRAVDVYFDGSRRQVVKTEEVLNMDSDVLPGWEGPGTGGSGIPGVRGR